MNSDNKPKFSVGQIIHHKMFNYRGVIIDVDPIFNGSDEWYEIVARTRPPKDKPWYHVLVDESEARTYVAERNLEPDRSNEPINHPELYSFFTDYKEGVYIPKSLN